MDIRLLNIAITLPNQEIPLFKIDRLEISSGSKILIQGASGKGKTTLLHLMSGLFLPNEGHIFWDDTRLDHLSEPQRAKIRRKNSALIFQKLNLIEHMTALENILLALNVSNKNEKQKKALSALREVSLEDKRDTLSVFLSLGEQQRVAVARALAQDAKVIFADEPTSSLDDKNANLVMDALFRVTVGKTLIVVSHDHRIASRFQKIISFEEYCR